MKPEARTEMTSPSLELARLKAWSIEHGNRGRQCHILAEHDDRGKPYYVVRSRPLPLYARDDEMDSTVKNMLIWCAVFCVLLMIDLTAIFAYTDLVFRYPIILGGLLVGTAFILIATIAWLELR